MDIAMDQSAARHRDLVTLARRGDEEAFRRLVEPELEGALRSAAIVLGSEADAGDVVQDAMVSAWLHLRSLREPGAFPAWFRRIVIRETTRSAKRRRPVSELFDAEPDPAASVDRAFEARQLARAFRSLDVADRTILTLRHLLRLGVTETGQTLELPDGTVKSRTHQAMQRLRAAYEAENRR